ncbi:FAD-dependent monooxygenase [Paramicrobacterium agarici]|uniref:2-polyprenyl-6-methoxyphenol hydroxylase-like FAD-dependent oxidoreductase n=1 Tax=Paramicrobacterium agarici TaxID=630514 RepID=A0A2A9DWI0_9MICO|nr:FAD-dependent monooxygenase [Microbacterium agarici]PFG30269.1 2-polyprenyl-6-methoxyphenol hydroxylase-like FAD-dependent oxidoreductase [Microbacterium agarici]TQO23276.1 2-polyprenyl-6-methoxyphenol hydroxylase-like FAD-dependent oxidoreductase [Microbacterium agarici]
MKVLICGAGISGLALAARLDHHGWDVTVVDKAPGPRPQGYMIDFSGPGFEAMHRMGLGERLRDAASRVGTFRYVDRTGRTTVSVEYSRFVTALRGEIVSIMRPALERVLRESLRDSVKVRYGVTVDAISESSATLSDGTELEPDLIVGADGIHSRIRTLVFGAEQKYIRDLGMHTNAFVFRDREIYDAVDGQFVLTETLNRQMGFYGLGDGRIATFSVYRATERGGNSDARGELRKQLSGMGELVDRALAQCPPPAEIYDDRVAQIEMPQWTSGRVALIGDAASAVSLVAGQGASLGVAGAYVLGELLSQGRTIPDAISEYERRWRPETVAVQAAARDRVIEWFLPRSTSTLLLRRWGFRAMRVPGLSRLMTGSLLPKGHRSVTELSEAV